jgi:hypothetical protein
MCPPACTLAGEFGDHLAERLVGHGDNVAGSSSAAAYPIMPSSRALLERRFNKRLSL